MADIFEAIKSGDSARITALLDADPSLLQSRANNVSPVMMALYVGRPELATLMLERGARLTFHEACALGDLDRVRSMLQSDPALLDRKSEDGYPGVGLAIFFRQPAVAQFLIGEGADVLASADNVNNVAPVHAAAAVCDRETMRMLLSRGADPNARQQKDYTALHGAASRGDIEMGKLLIEHEADPAARGTDGMTPGDVAVKYGHPAFAEWLRGLAVSR